jgi:hypothetical protein
LCFLLDMRRDVFLLDKDPARAASVIRVIICKLTFHCNLPAGYAFWIKL